jgi:two-component system, OmpR family, response regulator PhoP
MAAGLMRVLIVEDEQALREQLVERLRGEGYAVDAAADGEEGAYCGMELPLDAAIVDLGLPGISGIEMIRRWREAGRRFPVLILTARGQWQDKVDGLESGGDDYVVKPFHMQELLARLRALIRRSQGWAEPVLRRGAVALDLHTQSLTLSGESVVLTAFEYRILEYLMLHADRVVSKNELTEHVYDEDMERDSNVIEVLVGRLRRKLDPDASLNPIETLRGRGYRFRLQADSAC